MNLFLGDVHCTSELQASTNLIISSHFAVPVKFPSSPNPILGIRNTGQYNLVPFTRRSGTQREFRWQPSNDDYPGQSQVRAKRRTIRANLDRSEKRPEPLEVTLAATPRRRLVSSSIIDTEEHRRARFPKYLTHQPTRPPQQHISTMPPASSTGIMA